ncbi:P-loop containing nucleoside triphosphate hydrolase protein [Annulohypoxylon truncatum]|uniref:P-loop containing nucleoside triphosphate hydrolase protein n=1 Tax=Annulohypoxylon truncatum TaxID=327061 RepID=UPI0020088F8D|nr:P-loop containing nucleoside triphosphate hydrolase protein [Annulohypoxylon truncatum]KAI1207425.1 P-loop containing nucleoside triphosphate hydrolase protein [Annulohypoxylon truncatum]
MNPPESIPGKISVWMRECCSPRSSVETNQSVHNLEETCGATNTPKDMQEDIIIIAVMGKTGCGKSSFISKLAVKDYTGAVGHDLKSETHFIHEIECRVKGRKVLLIDTPGFDDTAGEDVIVLERIAKWLHNSYNDKKFLSALIYMHDIGETRVGRSSVKSFKLFRKITGQENMNNVVLLTTKWDDLGDDQVKGAERESQLKMNSDFWKGMIADGATFMRHDGTAESAEKATIGLLDKLPVVLSIQKQMAGGSSLHKTDAGAYINEELIKYQQRTEECIIQLKEEIEKATRQNNSIPNVHFQEHYDRKISELQETQKQQQRLIEIKFQEQENRIEEERAAAKKREDDKGEMLRIAKIIHRLDRITTNIATIATVMQVIATVATTTIKNPVLFTIVAAAMSSIAVAMMIANNVMHTRAVAIPRTAVEPTKGAVVVLG